MTDDGSNESDNNHTVTLSHTLSLGNHRGESMARYRGHVSYSDRIARMKILTCDCGRRLQSTKYISCKECRVRDLVLGEGEDAKPDEII